MYGVSQRNFFCELMSIFVDCEHPWQIPVTIVGMELCQQYSFRINNGPGCPQSLVNIHKIDLQLVLAGESGCDEPEMRALIDVVLVGSAVSQPSIGWDETAELSVVGPVPTSLPSTPPHALASAANDAHAEGNAAKLLLLSRETVGDISVTNHRKSEQGRRECAKVEAEAGVVILAGGSMLGRLLLLSSSSSSILRLHRRAGHIQSRQCHRHRQGGHMSIVHRARSVPCIFRKHGCRCEHFGGRVVWGAGCEWMWWDLCAKRGPAAADTRHFRKNSAAGLEAGACHRTTFEVGTTPGTAHSYKALIMSHWQSQNYDNNDADKSGKAKGAPSHGYW